MKQEIIRLGSACNQKCLFCNQEEELEKKDKKQITYFLLKNRKEGVERIVLSGGEPTLFEEELIFAIKTAKKLGYKLVELQSNAVLLSDISYTKKLKEAGLDTAMISLHSQDEKISDDITLASGTHKKTILGIKNLISVGVKTTINIVINEYNYKEIKDYIIFVEENLAGFDDISLSIAVPGNLTIKNKLLPRYSDIAPYLILAYKYAVSKNISFQNPGCGIPVCFVKDYYKYSLEYNNYKSGNMYDEKILEKNLENKLKSSECSKCVFDKYCLGIWKGYSDIYGFDEIRPINSL